MNFPCKSCRNYNETHSSISGVVSECIPERIGREIPTGILRGNLGGISDDIPSENSAWIPLEIPKIMSPRISMIFAPVVTPETFLGNSAEIHSDIPSEALPGILYCSLRIFCAENPEGIDSS